MVVIEHNLEVIKTADWVLDLGPDGGAGGGRLVAEGPPEEIVKVAESYTGQYLARHLPRSAAAKKRAINAGRDSVAVARLSTGQHHFGHRRHAAAASLPSRQTSSRPACGAHLDGDARAGVHDGRRRPCQVLADGTPVQAAIAATRRRLFSIGVPSPHTRGRQPSDPIAPARWRRPCRRDRCASASPSRSINIRSPGAQPATRNSTGRATGAASRQRQASSNVAHRSRRRYASRCSGGGRPLAQEGL